MVAQPVMRTLPTASTTNQIAVQVVQRDLILPDVLKLTLAVPGTTQAPAPYRPGQFITLPIRNAHQTFYRSYSLCGEGRPDRPWTITIKRVPHGLISSYLHDMVQVGMILHASPPRGTFTLPADLSRSTPLIFVAAGSGITPIYGMLRALAHLSPQYRPFVQLHYAARSPEEMIYQRELAALDPQGQWLQRWEYFSTYGQRLTPQQVLARVGGWVRHVHWYICGPESLKRDLQGTLAAAHVAEQQVHVEVFVSPGTLASGRTGALRAMPRGAPTRLIVADTREVLEVRGHETLLTALERQGYRPEFSCRAGACGTCWLRVLAGQATQAGEALSPAERRAGYVLGCVSHPIGDVTIASGGRPPARIAASLPKGRSTFTSQRPGLSWLRAGAVVGVIGLLVGFWNLTQPGQSTSGSSSTTTGGASGSSSQGNGSSNTNNGNNGGGGSTQGNQVPVPTVQSGTS